MNIVYPELTKEELASFKKTVSDDYAVADKKSRIKRGILVLVAAMPLIVVLLPSLFKQISTDIFLAGCATTILLLFIIPFIVDSQCRDCELETILDCLVDLEANLKDIDFVRTNEEKLLVCHAASTSEYFVAIQQSDGIVEYLDIPCVYKDNILSFAVVDILYEEMKERYEKSKKMHF